MAAAMFVPASPAEQAKDDVAESSQCMGGMPGVDLAGIFTHRHIPYIVIAILNRPMPSPE
jgi:hypothetical protein